LRATDKVSYLFDENFNWDNIGLLTLQIM
jgi:hypothetical protein